MMNGWLDLMSSLKKNIGEYREFPNIPCRSPFLLCDTDLIAPTLKSLTGASLETKEMIKEGSSKVTLICFRLTAWWFITP